jgi:ATP-dependent protease ClpP protease subunit
MQKLDSNIGAFHNHAINPFIVTAEETKIYKYKPRLYNHFETSEDFVHTLEVLEQATQNDIVELHINSGGGSVDALSTLLHAMKKCEAHVKCIFTGQCASAATFPLFYCDEFEIAEDATFLFHEAICGAPAETMSASRDYTEHTYKHLERMLCSTYEYFFTDEELQQLLTGKQFYMFPDEVMQRFNNRNECLSTLLDIESQQSDEQFEN